MNFDGPVRVADNAGSGTATIIVSFDAWNEGKVAPTIHQVVVNPAKAGPKIEPVAPNLVATLVHPERMANVFTVKFSPDGKRLFTAGYPSGIIQLWDVASQKELRRINSPAGYRGSADYALLTPDWKAVYVPVERRKIVRGERQGKAFVRVEESGEVRVWDLMTGEEKASLKATADSAPVHADLSPNGTDLVCVERFSRDSDEPDKTATVVWNLKTLEKKKWKERYSVPSFSPDAKTFAVADSDLEAKKSVARIFDAATFKELAKLDCPETDRYFSVTSISPDGSMLALGLGGKKGAPIEVWFRDAKNLADRGKYIGKADPNRFGWGGGRFTPDGSRYLILANEVVDVWDVAAKKVVRTIDVGPNASRMAIAPDGKTLAVAWVPKGDDTEDESREPDPADLPQPRVSLLDLAGNAPARVLVCPHGYMGSMAFSPDGKTLAFGSAGGIHLFRVGK